MTAPRTAIRPMLASFHQKEGVCIAVGMSGRMKPILTNALSSIRPRMTRTTASRRKLRRLTGLRSLERRSISDSVRIVDLSEDGRQVLESAMNINFHERHRLSGSLRRLDDTVTLNLHEPYYIRLRRLETVEQLTQR
jgi:hypothetical protein